LEILEIRVFKQTTRDLRRQNRSKALREIYFNGPISRLEICQRTDMSQATVTNVVADLLGDKFVIESGCKDSDGGRPIALLTINPQYGHIIGIDVGETVIQVSMFDLCFQELYTVFQPLSLEENQPEQVVQHIVNGVEQLFSGSGIRRDQILGVGIGFPGLVEHEAGISIFAPNWGWHDVPIASILESKLGLPMSLDNGAKAMALAESMFGAGRDVDSMAVLLVGTGVGAGIIEGGALYRGAMNSAGELGHTILEMGGRLCRCGNKGCLESYVGAPGIIARYSERIQPGDPKLSGDQKEMVRTIIRAAQAGNATAQTVLDDTLNYLALGIGNLINLVNPQKIVLGGWVVMMLAEEILPRLSETVSQYALQQPFKRTEFGLCKLKEEAVAQGAATLILEQFLQSAGSPLALHAQVVN
jgi:predicted NBD/HSP70 family sugar kinase